MESGQDSGRGNATPNPAADAGIMQLDLLSEVVAEMSRGSHNRNDGRLASLIPLQMCQVS